MMPQRLVKDSWHKIRARLVKARTGWVEARLNVNGMPRMAAYAEPADHELVSSGRRRKYGVQFVQVKVLSDVPTFVGLDTQNYDLKKGDVVFVPRANARVLCERGVAVLRSESSLESPAYDATSHLREEDDTLVRPSAC